MADHRVKRGTNLIHKRLDERLAALGWGSVEALAAKLHLMSGRPGYEKLGDLLTNAISKIRHNDRSVTDYELVAIANGLNVTVDWLLGLTPADGAHAERLRSAGEGLSLHDRALADGDQIELLIQGRWIPVRVQLRQDMEPARCGPWWGVCEQDPSAPDGVPLQMLLLEGLVARRPI